MTLWIVHRILELGHNYATFTLNFFRVKLGMKHHVRKNIKGHFNLGAGALHVVSHLFTACVSILLSSNIISSFGHSFCVRILVCALEEHMLLKVRDAVFQRGLTA